MKVWFLANIPAPYRVDFFNSLGNKCDLTVTYDRKRALDRNDKWFSNKSLNYKSVFLKGINIGKDFALSFSPLKILFKQKFDIIIIGGYSSPTSMLTILLLNILKKPFILNVDGGFIKSDNSIVYSIKKYFISSANIWLSSGSESDKYLIYYGACEKKIYHYPFTSIYQKEIIDKPVSEYEKAIGRKKLNITEKKVILSVGRIIPEKGFDVFLKAVRNINKDVGVYIIGGEPTPELEFQKKQYNLNNVHFIEFKSKETVRDFYRVADLFVLPTRGDIWGLVINEAMANGLPVITTNRCIAGLELIENEINGFIVPVDNDKELSIKINEIIFDQEKLIQMGENNIDKIQKYTIEEMTEIHLEILRKIQGKESL